MQILLIPFSRNGATDGFCLEGLSCGRSDTQAGRSPKTSPNQEAPQVVINNPPVHLTAHCSVEGWLSGTVHLMTATTCDLSRQGPSQLDPKNYLCRLCSVFAQAERIPKLLKCCREKRDGSCFSVQQLQKSKSNTW